MAIYEPIAEPDLRALCMRFGLELSAAAGVPQGSINTNYRLECSQGLYFLRFTRARDEAELAFEAGLLRHLKSAGFPCPEPLPADGGAPFVGYRGGFVSVFPFLPGDELPAANVGAVHAEQIGRILGRMHRIGASFGGKRTNPYGQQTLRRWLEELGGVKLAPEVAAAVERAARALPPSAQPAGLPQGPIHADLFRDNVKWLGERVAAVFDFEMACVDDWALDLGVTIDVWCFGASAFDRPRARSLVAGYQSERRLRPEESDGLWARALFGAARFTLSRIRDFHLAKVGDDALVKKPWQRYAQRMDELVRLREAGFRDLVGI